MKTSEVERENLVKSKDDAERYLVKEREIQTKKNIIYQINASIAEQNVVEFQEREKNLSEKLAHEKSKVSANSVRLKEAKGKCDNISEQHAAVSNELQRCNSVKLLIAKLNAALLF